MCVYADATPTTRTSWKKTSSIVRRTSFSFPSFLSLPLQTLTSLNGPNSDLHLPPHLHRPLRQERRLSTVIEERGICSRVGSMSYFSLFAFFSSPALFHGSSCVGGWRVVCSSGVRTTNVEGPVYRIGSYFADRILSSCYVIFLDERTR